MDESGGGNESRVLTEELVEGVDKLTKSPSNRAGALWNDLSIPIRKASNWDLICFCVETLGLMSSEFPWLREAAMTASRLVYEAHYLNQDRIIASEHEMNPKAMNIPTMTGE